MQQMLKWLACYTLANLNVIALLICALIQMSRHAERYPTLNAGGRKLHLFLMGFIGPCHRTWTKLLTI